MKIGLIQPPRHPSPAVFGEMQPYALQVLATSVLQDKELQDRVRVKIIDLRFAPMDRFKTWLSNTRPDIIGITGITIDQPTILEIAQVSKKYSPETRVVVGGHHATMLPEDFFRSEVDLIVRGFGHHIFPEIVKGRLSKKNEFSDLRGVIQQTEPEKFVECPGWRKNIIGSPPSPDPSLVTRRYFCFGKYMSVVTTAQGCSGRCTFCACWRATGGKYIMKSPEDVVQEIINAREKYVFLGDDNTFDNLARAWEIVRLLKDRRVHKMYDGYCQAKIIAENPDLFKRWAKIGLKWLTVGSEAISDERLKKIKKDSTVEINEEANRVLQSCGIVNYAHFMIYPDFSLDDFNDILEYIYKHGIVEPVFPIFTPLPGTDEWYKYKDEVAQKPRQFFDLAHPLTKTSLSIEEFYAKLFELYWAIYSKKRWIKAKVKGLINVLPGIWKFPQNEAMAPGLIAAFFTKRMLRKQLSPEKIKGFIDLL